MHIDIKKQQLIKKSIKNILKYLDKHIVIIVQKSISRKNKNFQGVSSKQNKKLLIDCSFIYNTNLNTGIQRVVNNILKYADDYAKKRGIQILTVVLEDGFITEVDLTQKRVIISENQFWLIRLIKRVQKRLYWYNLSYTSPVCINDKDILLMLDSSWGLNIWQSLKEAKDKGTTILGVVYDLIPISHPHFCDDNLVGVFSEYLDKTTHYFDGYLAISKTVMVDLQSYLNSKNIELSQYSFDYFKLGTDFKPAEYSIGSIRDQLQKVYTENHSVYLIVSTIEPRKNHQYLFDVFKELWKQGIDVTLVIVGKVGWKTEDLIKQIRQCPEYEIRLFMFNDLDDNELNYCYSKSKALLFPSYVEGFGLPIIESLQNGLSVLASDTTIHKEVGGDMIEYFDIEDITSLTNKIHDIEYSNTLLKQPDEKKLIINTWKESTLELLDKVLLSNDEKYTNGIK